MKDYRLELTVKNGLLWRAMKDFGHETVASLSRACGVGQCDLGKFMNLKKPPIGRNAEPVPTAQRLCDYFGVGVEELFPPDVLYEGVKNNKIERWASREELMGIGGDSELTALDEMLESERTDAVQSALAGLTAREQDVISKTFGFEGEEMTMQEVADEYGLSQGRIHQIHAKALRKLRHPTRSDHLKQVLPH